MGSSGSIWQKVEYIERVYIKVYIIIRAGLYYNYIKGFNMIINQDFVSEEIHLFYPNIRFVFEDADYCITFSYGISNGDYFIDVKFNNKFSKFEELPKYIQDILYLDRIK